MFNEHFLKGLQAACAFRAKQDAALIRRRVREKVGQCAEGALHAPVNLHRWNAASGVAFARLQFVARIRFQFMQKIIATKVQLGRFK